MLRGFSVTGYTLNSSSFSYDDDCAAWVEVRDTKGADTMVREQCTMYNVHIKHADSL